MELDAPVEAQHGEFDVEAQTQSRVESQLFVKPIEAEDRIVRILLRILPDVPDIAQIEEGRPVDDPPDREAQFEVGLQLHVAGLHRIVVAGIGHRSLSEGPGRPAAHAVAAAAVELAVERHGGGVAVGHRHASVEAPDERRHVAQHDFPADAEVRTEILRITDAEDRIVVLVPGRGEEHVFDGVDQVAGSLGVETDIRGVASEILALVVVTVTERKAADELRRETFEQVAVLGELRLAVGTGVVDHQERGVEVVHIDHVDVDRPQRERRITVVGPHVGDAGAGKRAAVVGTVLEIDRQFDLGPGLVHRAETPRQQEAREREARGDAELRGPLLLGIGGLHKLVARREGDVERLSPAEDVAVLVAEGGFQPVETRRGAPLEIDLNALFERRRAEDVAREVPLAGVECPGRIGRRTDEGNIVVGVVRRPGLLLESDPGAFEIPEGHQVGVGAVDLRRVVDVVGIERHSLPEHRRAQIGTLLVDDVQTPVIERIEARDQRGVGPRDGRIVVRKDVDPVDAVDHVVVHDGLPACVVTGEILLDDHAQIDLAVAAQRVGPEHDVVDRKIVVPPFLEVGGDALPLGVEHRDIVDVPPAEQRARRIGQHDLFEELVLEFVGDRVDAVGFALMRAVGDPGALAARRGIDLERSPRVEKPLRVHIDFQVLGALLRQPRFQQHGRLPDLALPVIPAVVFRRIGLFVQPDVEIGSEEALVGSLAHVFLQIGGRDTVPAGRRFVVLDLHPLHEVLPFGNVPRDAASRAEKAQRRGGEYAAHPAHNVSC